MERTFFIVILVLIGLLFLQRECTRPEPVTINYPVFIYDTVEIVNTIRPDPIVIEVPGDTIYYRDTIFVNDGSLPQHLWDIISEHFSRKFYDEVLINDSSAYLKVGVELYKNNVEDLSYSFINRRPIGVICPDIPDVTNKWFVGGTVLGSPTQFGAGPSVGLLTRKDGLYTYSWDAVNNTHQVSVFWKLSFR